MIVCMYVSNCEEGITKKQATHTENHYEKKVFSG